jgi:prolyl-tRNA synthetase
MITPRSEDYSRWYTDVVQKSNMADYAPVRGCMIIKPYGYALWEQIQAQLDRRFKDTGHENAYFPLLIPEEFMTKEQENFEGFSPELAVVTIGGGEELQERLVIRPTSETVIGHAFSNWIQSYRDLPLLINQWANVVRWEMRTRLFLRTMEFLWQEGHTAHATHDEAEAETMQMLDVYTDFAVNEAAIPVIRGRKSNQERFAGALRTYSIEAMMGDKRALQSGTSHNLGQNFSKAFNITYTDVNNETQHCWTTSWGLSTRMVGAIVMTHGDDIGLRMPPRLAPVQVVIVPIFKSDDEKSQVLPAAQALLAELKAAGIRVKLDTRENLTPGFKFNDWEMRGVPVRAEIGPKDVQNGTVAVARRDMPGKAGKQFAPRAGVVALITDLLEQIQHNLLEQATAFRDSNIHEVKNYDEMRQVIASGGWALAWFSGDAEDEARVKEDNQAVSRCFPLGQEKSQGTCVVSGKPATERALFAKAY